LCSTPSRMSAAMRRAARPGTSDGRANRRAGMEREHLGEIGERGVWCSCHQEGNTPLAWEYAKYKNRPLPIPASRHDLIDGASIAQRRFGMTDAASRRVADSPQGERKPLTPAAQRALAEAEARRKAAEAGAKPLAKEFQGPKGPEPTRYGDWENKGIASDF
jgi:hypothetical protein